MQLGRLFYPVPLYNVNHVRRNILMPHHLLDIHYGSAAIDRQVGCYVTEAVHSDLRPRIIVRLKFNKSIPL